MKVNICGVSHEVKKVMAIDEGCNGITLGKIDHSKAEIELRSGMPSGLEQSTLFHEVLHGMLVQLGYNSLSEDETFVQGFSNAMYQMFDFKPEVIKYD